MSINVNTDMMLGTATPALADAALKLDDKG
jgi:hypothetical protein